MQPRVVARRRGGLVREHMPRQHVHRRQRPVGRRCKRRARVGGTQPSSVQLRMQQDGAEIEEAILREREEVRAETTAAQRRAAALCRSPNADV